MTLVQEYQVLVNDVVSYREKVFDGASAEIHNKKVKRMWAIAYEIEQSSPELKGEFYQLIFDENEDVRLWVAHHMLESMSYDKPCRKIALKVIRHRARTDKTAYGFGEKLWLRSWYKSHPSDRWI